MPLSRFFFRKSSPPKELASEVRKLAIEELDDVEVIKHDGDIWKVLNRSAYIGWRHVVYLLDISNGFSY